jgi:SAM-dependent methyltransferase
MNMLWELHSGLPREGPGSDEATKHVLSLLPQERFRHILDVGCGPGMQTLCLARCLHGSIVAVDNHQPYLDVLAKHAKAEHFDSRVKTRNASMEALPFDDGTFDLIWSEGAIYLVGFERGLKLWRRLLTANGVVVVSELTWLSSDPPEEARRFWKRNYPAMENLEKNAKLVADSGYDLLATYLLPPKAWFLDYYDPLERRIDLLCEKYKGDSALLAELNEQREEIDLYRRYYDAYGYVFYAMQQNVR